MDFVPTTLLKSDLKALVELDETVVADFSRFALELLRKGTAMSKGFNGAAKRLNVTVDEIRQMCYALCHVFSEAARSSTSEAVLGEYLHELGFRAGARQTLIQFFLENMEEIRDKSMNSQLDIPHYKQLEWRLDVQIASRSMRHEAVPSYLLKLTTQKGTNKAGSTSETEEHWMQADYPVLLQWCQQIETALQGAQAGDTRRMLRMIKR